jgi:peptide/nickel transport system permease protein
VATAETVIRPQRRRRVARAAVASVVFLLGMLAISYLVPHLIPYSPDEQSLADQFRPPVPFEGYTWSHPLGTDNLGRDMLARIAEGARVSLTVSLVAVAIAGVAGAALGMFAGFFGRWLDTAVQLLAEVQVSFPGLLLAILFIALVGASLRTLIVILALLGWMVFTRAARAAVMTQRRQDYVPSAYAVGAGSMRVLFRHIAPTILPGLAVIAALETAQNMLAESALSFLGLGIQPPGVSWGLMMAEGREYMTTAWWLVVLPGIAIISAVLSVMVLAEASRKRIQDR